MTRKIKRGVTNDIEKYNEMSKNNEKSEDKYPER